MIRRLDRRPADAMDKMDDGKTLHFEFAETAKAQGFDIVLYHDQFQPRSNDPEAIREAISARKVLYVSPAADLSQAVLQTLNTRYRAQPRQPMLSLPGMQP